MKRFRYSMLLFFAAAVFVAAGLVSRPLLSGTWQAAAGLARTGDVDSFIDGVDAASRELRYKNELIDLWSLWYRLTDTREVVKEDATVLRLDNDFLAFSPALADDETLAGMADAVSGLKAVTDGLDIPLLYVLAPNKAALDRGGDNAVRENHLALARALEERGISVLDLMPELIAGGRSMEDSWFRTDHHWLPQTGLWAAGALCRALPEVPLNTAALAADGYRTQVYPRLFLGSEGKKVGRWFTPLGLDDFPLVTPAFATELTITDRTGTRSGDFSETVVQERYLEADDIYAANPYVTYTGGDFPLQVIQNHRMEEGPTLLVIRDSYACTVTPFLSLAAGELHTVDVRYWQGVAGADSITDYVELLKPDAVVILYAGVSPHMFAFDGEKAP